MCDSDDFRRKIALYNGVALGALLATFFAASFRRKMTYERQWKMFVLLGLVMWGVAATMVWLRPSCPQSCGSVCTNGNTSTYPYLFLLIGYAWLYVAFSIRRRMLLGEQNQYALLEEGNAAEESVEAIPPPYDEARARQPLLGEGGAEAAPPSYGSLSPVPPALAAELSPQDSLHEPPKEELPDYSAPGTPS
eukprot:m.124139 g.124139  ORF g.124139 m.124139 type:complete len:192 (-) comp22061_c0_seq3:385-960(-)